MTVAANGFEVCDCHSHVYGSYDRFPLPLERTFDPPESPIESLEATWRACGVSHAVLIQGSAYGNDHRALLDGIASDPERRRGVAIVHPTASNDQLIELDRGGVRALRFNWVRHLLQRNKESASSMLESAASLARRVFRLGWHVEVHVDPESLDMIEQLESPQGQIVVIDHMARVDATFGLSQSAFQLLQRLLDRKHIWIKLSGADRVASGAFSLSAAAPFVYALATQAPDRCVWGLDWPHLNLGTVYEDRKLRALLDEAIPDPEVRRGILSNNPARLYGFPGIGI